MKGCAFVGMFVVYGVGLLLGWWLIGPQIIVPLLIVYAISFVLAMLTAITPWLGILSLIFFIGAGWYMWTHYGWKVAIIFVVTGIIDEVIGGILSSAAGD